MNEVKVRFYLLYACYPVENSPLGAELYISENWEIVAVDCAYMSTLSSVHICVLRVVNILPSPHGAEDLS